MESKDTQFLAEMYHLAKKMGGLIEEFDVKDRVLASVVVGVLSPQDIELGEETAEMRTMYSFHIQDRLELETIKSLMDEMYNDEDDDSLEGMLGSLGISLN